MNCICGHGEDEHREERRECEHEDCMCVMFEQGQEDAAIAAGEDDEDATCPECGRQLFGHTNYCPHCAIALAAQVPGTPAGEET